MNYIGSKYSLLGEIRNILDGSGVPRAGIALDLFAGTGIVAQMLKQRGHIVYANDWQHYSFVTCAATIALNEPPRFPALLADRSSALLETRSAVPAPTCSVSGTEWSPATPPCTQVLGYLNGLPGRFGTFCHSYCEGGSAGRLYFSKENGSRIQAIRDTIERWRSQSLIDEMEAYWLIACLIEAADRVANTASVYGAFLKHVKKAAAKPLMLPALRPVSSKHAATKHRAFNDDAALLVPRLRDEPITVAYVDPPYNERQYSANYHILETIARWDLGGFVPRGVTGLRPADQCRSGYCTRSTVRNAVRELLAMLKADYILFSYNNEGLLSEQDLLALFEEACHGVRVERVAFRRFRADSDGANRVYKSDATEEFLILGRRQHSQRSLFFADPKKESRLLSAAAASVVTNAKSPSRRVGESRFDGGAGNKIAGDA